MTPLQHLPLLPLSNIILRLSPGNDEYLCPAQSDGNKKVPGETAYCHHLLEFVIIRSASEASLTGIAPTPRQEGADRSGLSPAPLEGVLISRGNFPPSEGGDAVERAVADLKVNEFESFARRFGATRR